jgi:glycosyltransferase involved in cell wall biosynthesis
MSDRAPIRVSVVIPVYDGAKTLPTVVDELLTLTSTQATPHGRSFAVTEILLVWDRGSTDSANTIRDLADMHDVVEPVWLSRNFGQHAATLAGLTSANGQWIVTMDEDGQQDPRFIGAMLDRAFDTQSQLVYAAPTNAAPHSGLRNAASRATKWFFLKVLAEGSFTEFNSYRLIHGEIARTVAAYTGSGVYLDVALSWVVARVTQEPVVSRVEGRPAGNYSFGRLVGHFLRLVVSSGTRPLLFVSTLGIVFVILGAVLTAWIIYNAFAGGVPIGGWASTMVAILVVGGATLLSLGIIAQYVGAATNMSLGKPLYVVVSDPEETFGA